MKHLFTLLLVIGALCSLNVNAQKSSNAKVPIQRTGTTKGLQWTRSKPLSLSGSFKTPMPFKLPKDYASGKHFAKSVGDGTIINGCVISANNWTEENLHYGIYSFEAKGNFTLTPIKENENFNSPRAVFAKGKYYIYSVTEFFGSILYLSCTVYNSDTWEEINSYENETVWSNIPYASSLTYDPISDNVYGITYGADSNSFYLSIMDKENGSFTKVCDLSMSFITLAASPDGTLYGISDNGALYKLDKDGKETYIGSTGLAPKYAQSMTCDPITGKLYWAFINDTESALYEVNTQSGAAYKIDDMPNGEEIVGMFIETPEISETAPSSVSDLKFTPDQNGSLTGTLSCVAPIKDRKGDNLSGTVKVTIYSAGEKIIEQDVAPGATVKKENYTFKANELYTLYAIASNASGNGPKNSITVYIGKDNASAPTDIILNIEDKKATLTWKAPVKGLNDGYINPAEISYKVVRHAGNDEGVLITTTQAGVTSCEDVVTNATAQYYYEVTAIYNGQEGGTGVSNKVLSVGAYELPFYDDFSDGELCKALYTYLDIDNDGHDNMSLWFWKEDEKLMQFCSDNEHVGNDWLITPAIHLDGKNLYDLGFSINMGATSNLRVTIGTSTDPKDHSTVLDLQNINDSWRTDYSAVVKAPKDGNYYIGFYAYSGLEGFYLNLFDIKLEAGMSSEIPDSVYNLKVIPGEMGEAFAELSFNAPNKLINDTEISNPLKVNIYRNDELAKEIETTPGSPVQWKDENPVLGQNTYRIVALMDQKEGLAHSKTVWIGPDISEPVKDMTAKTVDGNMHVCLTWKAPEKGANGGYFDINNVTYSVWRSLDGDEFEQLEKDLKVLTYTDIQVEQEVTGKQESYYYAVTADTKSGISSADARFIVVGTPYTTPEWESFPKGQFHIYPWTTESIEGSFGWECLTNDKSAGVYPQDDDKGFIKFQNSWDDRADSRLKTPIFDLSGSKNPTFSFFMFHWNADDVEADGGKTKIAIEISVDGGEFIQVGEAITAAYDREGWVEHRIDLSEFKNAKQVQFGLRGSTDNNWMYFYVDNIHIDEQEDYDLAIAGFSGTTNANVNEEGIYSIEYFNRGLQTASGYTIDLYQDDNLIQSLKGDDIEPGEAKTVDAKVILNASTADKESVFYAVITYDKDRNTENNQTSSVTTTIKGTWYPGIENLNGTAKGDEVTLTWTPPVIPTDVKETEDSVEDYEPFAINNIGNWITYDGDQHGCGSMSDLPDYPNKGVNQAFQVWAPAYIEATPELYPSIQPRTGDQCFISWYANVNIDGVAPYNDDYLISPEVLGGTKVSFYIHRINEKTTEEYYQIMYSTTTQDPKEFKVLQEGEAGFEWEKVEATLPEEARYFAIHYMAEDGWGILIDDISYTSAIYALKVSGYNIFRNGQKINDALLTEPTFVDTNLPEGNHKYQVSVVYDRGESNASEAVEVSILSGISEIEAGIQVYGEKNHITIITENMQPATIYAMDGISIISRNVTGRADFPVQKGMYIVKVGENVFKVAVKG